VMDRFLTQMTTSSVCLSWKAMEKMKFSFHNS
jgi:hypothetical protein